MSEGRAGMHLRRIAYVALAFIALGGMACVYRIAQVHTMKRELVERGAEIWNGALDCFYDDCRRGAESTFARFVETDLLLEGPEFGDRDIQRCEVFPFVRGIGISRSKCTDLCMPQIAAFAKVDSLLLDNTAITDAGLEKITNSQALERLVLDSTRITEAGLQMLATCPRLRFISICSARLRELNIDSRFARLERIECEDNPIEAVAVTGAPFLEAVEIQSRHLRSCRISGCAAMTRVLISCERKDSRPEVLIEDMPMLDELDVGADVWRVIALSIRRCGRLRRCHLMASNIDAGLLSQLLDESPIEDIAIDCDELQDGERFFTAIGRSSRMKRVALLYYDGLMPRDIRAMVPARSLECLDLSGTEMSAEIIDAVSEVRQLKRLVVKRSNVSAVDLQSIARLSFLDSIAVGNQQGANSVASLKQRWKGVLPNTTIEE